MSSLTIPPKQLTEITAPVLSGTGVKLFAVEGEPGQVIFEVMGYNDYMVIFEDAEVFNEKCRILKPGLNAFSRVPGSTRNTGFQIVEIQLSRTVPKIPPPG